MASKAFGARKFSLLWMTHKMVVHGGMNKPIWLDALKRNQLPTTVVQTKKPKEIVYEEDRLLEKYYKKNPVLREEEVIDPRADTVQVPGAVFVSKQLNLMRTKGLTEDEAYDRIMSEGWKINVIGHFDDDGKQGFNKSDQYTLSLRSAYDSYLHAEQQLWKAYATCKPEQEDTVTPSQERHISTNNTNTTTKNATD